jgi:N-formylglutamate amidohydrolase
MAPLVLDSPHSGHDFPADFGAVVTEAELRESEDCYVDELYAAAHELGVPLLAATFPRTYLDPNRNAGDVDLDLIDGPWSWEYRPSGKARIGKSLIWRTLEDGRPIYGRKLAPEAVRRRIDRVHAPYHRSLQEMLEAAFRKHGRVYHINCHSMRSVAGKQSEDGPGSVRPDFVIGDRDGTTCEPRFTELVRETLAGMGYRVTVNDPYKGVELIRAYSDPKAGRHSLQIEINKRLYMDERTLQKNAGFSTIQKNLGELLRVLIDEISD